jgi:hypothetical protein
MILAPFAEKSWLAKVSGDAFETYRWEVPRFIGPVKSSGSVL